MPLMAGAALVVLTALTLAVLGAEGLGIPPMYRVHTFYYLWYTEPSGGGWTHWDHEVLPHWDAAVAAKYPQAVRFEPPHCIHSPFYPLRGPYSSTSRDLIRQHLRDMEEHGIGVLVASWWGPPWRRGSHDTQRVNTDARLELVIREIEETGSAVRVAFHLEPYEGRTKETVYEDLVYLASKYKETHAVLRFNGRPVYYVYDSYRLPPADWAWLLRRNDGPLNVRGTDADGFFLGLWLDKDDGDEDLLPAGFEGFYTYFSSEQVSFGSNPDNWAAMQQWALSKGMLFVPSIGPGYNDGKIRPWNLAATREREGGNRYRAQWAAALGVGAQFISITSYNEWGEGTQIEPAVPREQFKGCEYLSYEPQSPYLYMEITLAGVQRLGTLLEAASAGSKGREEEGQGQEQTGQMCGSQDEEDGQEGERERAVRAADGKGPAGAAEGGDGGDGDGSGGGGDGDGGTDGTDVSAR